MLDALRQGAGKWIGTVFIALLALSFGIWGIQDVFLGTNTRAIATVGNTDISSIRFERTYLAQMRQLGRRFNRAITPREAVALGLPGQILGIMVNEATLNDAAKGMNLGVSDDLVTKSIAKDERFRDPSGNFDRNYFRQILNQNNMTEDLFVIEQRNTVLRQQVAAGLIGGIGVPNTYLNVVNISQRRARDQIHHPGAISCRRHRRTDRKRA
jgi:peptidyl-prolyl cis-trans isomerase D